MLFTMRSQSISKLIRRLKVPLAYVFVAYFLLEFFFTSDISLLILYNYLVYFVYRHFFTDIFVYLIFSLSKNVSSYILSADNKLLTTNRNESVDASRSLASEKYNNALQLAQVYYYLLSNLFINFLKSTVLSTKHHFSKIYLAALI